MKLWSLVFQLIVVGGLFTALWAILLVAFIEPPGSHPSLPRARGGSGLLSTLDQKIGKLGPRSILQAIGVGGGGGGKRGGDAAGAVATPGDGGSAASEPWPQTFEIYISPRPSPLPEEETPFNLRNCECVENWRELVGTAASACECGGRKCPPRVNPKFITEAEGQDVCSLLRHTGYSCTVGCGDGDKVNWYGKACGKPDQEECPPLVRTPSSSPSPSKTPRPPIVVPVMDWDPKEVYDLRGAGCEMKDGVEVCFTEDSQGRTLCPAVVTSKYLAFPEPQTVPTECLPQHAADQYCIVQCQPGNDVVRWWPHSVAWCYSPENYGNCPMR